LYDARRPDIAFPSADEFVADMKDASSGEEDDEHYLDKVNKSSNKPTGKTKKQREEELRKMMDDDGELPDIGAISLS
jgi:hypothetical protein